MTYETVFHNFPPLYDQNSRILLLGSIPSPKSREQAFFYGHPQNRFWRVLSSILNEPMPQQIEEKRAMCHAHHIALWDVLASCEIQGASDAAIRNPVANDIHSILTQAPIQAIFTTGRTANKLYHKLCEPQTGIPAGLLPSTSPANAAWSVDRLCEAYQEILLHLK